VGKGSIMKKKFRLKPEYAIMGHNIVVELFLAIKDSWFTNTNNSFYGKKDKFRKFLLTYIQDKTVYTQDTDLIQATTKFNRYLKWFEEIKEI